MQKQKQLEAETCGFISPPFFTYFVEAEAGMEIWEGLLVLSNVMLAEGETFQGAGQGTLQPGNVGKQMDSRVPPQGTLRQALKMEV